MKIRIAFISLLLLCVTSTAVPTLAQVVYDNGPANGNTDAWTVNFGFIVSDTLRCCREVDGGPAGPSTITGFSFNAWLFPGDTVTSAELSITSQENGGTSFFDDTVNFTQGSCVANQFGFNVCLENSTFSGPTLSPGSYWVNLQNASTPSGDPVYWDENSGVGCGGSDGHGADCPSQASENSVGSIPSESFTLYGTSSSTTSTTTSTTTSVPEPSSIMLFGSGLLGLGQLLRRKLKL